jgi:hypothetical protein
MVSGCAVFCGARARNGRVLPTFVALICFITTRLPPMSFCRTDEIIYVECNLPGQPRLRREIGARKSRWQALSKIRSRQAAKREKK